MKAVKDFKVILERIPNNVLDVSKKDKILCSGE